MSLYKVSWSGGKDSTAAMFLHLCEGHSVHAVCFVPLLTPEIPLIMPEHYAFIINTADRFRSMGAVVDIVHGDTYYDHVHRIITRGIHKGLPMGIGLGIGFCLFRDYSKIRAGILSVKFDFDYEDIGIAFDEHKRKAQLISPKMSILCDKKITERQAFEICLEHDILSPIYYGTARRDGCAICPNCKTQDFLSWVRAYPDSVSVLLEIEDFCKKYRPNNSPYRNGVWFSDRLKQEYQYTFSDVENV